MQFQRQVPPTDAAARGSGGRARCPRDGAADCLGVPGSSTPDTDLSLFPMLPPVLPAQAPEGHATPETANDNTIPPRTPLNLHRLMPAPGPGRADSLANRDGSLKWRRPDLGWISGAPARGTAYPDHDASRSSMSRLFILDMASRCRGAIAPGFCGKRCAFRSEEGAGNAGRSPHPQPRVPKRGERHTSSQEKPNDRHSLRSGFTTYSAISPVFGLSSHRRRSISRST